MKKMLAVFAIVVLLVSSGAAEDFQYPFGISSNMEATEVISILETVFGGNLDYLDDLVGIDMYTTEPESIYYYNLPLTFLGISVSQKLGWSFTINLELKGITQNTAKIISDIYADLKSRYGEPSSITPELWELNQDGTKKPRIIISDPQILTGYLSDNHAASIFYQWQKNITFNFSVFDYENINEPITLYIRYAQQKE